MTPSALIREIRGSFSIKIKITITILQGTRLPAWQASLPQLP